MDRLFEEQKFEEALKLLERLRAEAAGANREADWTRALVTEVRARLALHGYETAVRRLAGEAKPREAVHRAVLELYYARVLTQYYQAYQWEINRRELVAASATADLRSWTREQIYAEALRAHEEVWKLRDALGQQPVARWAEYLDRNTYPDAIRGTLRDASAYLFVELLTDSAFWRPEESSDVYRLKPGELLLEPAAEPSQGSHPLVRLAWVLGDLETWHLAAGRREAALEAWLARVRALSGHFEEEADRALLAAAIEKRAEGLRDFPWWSVAMADLAALIRGGSGADALVRADRVARQGYEAHRESVGGRRCLSLFQSIEAPDFRVAAMRADGPARRSFEVEHRNLAALHFRAYAESAEERVRRPYGRSRRSERDELFRLMAVQKPAAEWRADLPATPDFRSHRTFVTPPLKAAGCYRVAASARPDFSETAGNRIVMLDFIVSGIVLETSLAPPDRLEARVVSGDSGEPLAGVPVALQRGDWQSPPQAVREEKTGEDGRAVFSVPSEPGRYLLTLLARRGADVALDNPPGYYSRTAPEAVAGASLIYTDRSIYRPGQRIFWKVLAYRREAGRQPAVYPSAAVTVSLRDPNGQQVEQRLVNTNAFGTASGEFTAPLGRLLGAWSLHSSMNGHATVRVEEYKRPTFEVLLKPPAAPLRLNRAAKIRGEARYYFGLPLTAGTARWTVTREPVYPWWWGWYGESADSRSRRVASGTSALAADGAFEVAFTPEADERLASGSSEVSYRFRVSADVTDEGGETRSTAKSFRLGFVSVEAKVESGTAFFLEERRLRFDLTRTDLDGEPRAGAASYRVVALAQPAATPLPADLPVEAPAKEGLRTPGDALRPRWDTPSDYRQFLRGWKDGGEIGSGTLAHDAGGRAALDLAGLPAGAYRIRYETRDDFGAVLRLAHEFIVAGPRMRLALPLILMPERSQVRPGETARFLAHSGLADQSCTFEVWRDGKLDQRRELRAGRDASLIELPVLEGDRGGLSVRLSSLRDYQFLSDSESLSVPFDNKKLTLEFSTFRDLLQPGAAEAWRITVRTPDGKSAEAGAAEVLAYMYDRSLDVFAAHNPPVPISLFHRRTGTEFLRASLGQAQMQWIYDLLAKVADAPELRGDQLRLLSGFGVGGPGRRRMAAGMPGGVVGGVAGGVPQEAVAREAAPAPVMAMMAMDAARPAQAEKKEATLAAPAEEPPPARADFAETAFWRPTLLTGADGSAAIEFTVPDSVTSWNVWIHALTRDLASASAFRQARSVKDLMVRPYMPRFLREGDRADLKVVVNNASAASMTGTVTLEIFDPESRESLLPRFGISGEGAARSFKAGPAGSDTLTYAITAPVAAGPVAFRVTGKAGTWSDGELRALPILPGRMHLMQTRFTTLRGPGRRELAFDDLSRGGDPSRLNERMVVTVDAQLFYSALSALPYLVNYPYECTEQMLNRFVSTGILSGLYAKYPAVARVAGDLARRETRLETWDAIDPNRKMALEETPWLAEAKGGDQGDLPLARVLDPRVARAEREASLAKLRKAQTAGGGFPWWPGGPPSPYMTLYLLYGFAKAAEFGVEVPRDMVERGWGYLAEHYRRELEARLAKEDCCWEFLTFLNYAATCYPDPSWMGNALTAEQRKSILDRSFRNWKKHSPYLKCMLALTLRRMGRPQDARLVFASVMDSARTTAEEGTFWAPEERAWLWYNDTIETHAFALRTLMEVTPGDDRADGLVQWLFLNKKLNHWKSTRATAEVLYSLAHYLQKQGTLAVREDATVRLCGQTVSYVFDPDQYTGKGNQTVIPGEKIGSECARVAVEKQGPGMAFASAAWHFSTETLPEQGSGDFLSVGRSYFKRESEGGRTVLRPLAEGAPLQVGDELEVRLSIRSKHACEYVHLRDPRAAGLEPGATVSRYKWETGISWYEETRDSGTNFFFEWLPAGEYTFRYRLRANMAGTFRVSPATLQSMYAPEFSAYSSGAVLRIRN